MEKSSKSELCIVTSRNIFDAPCLAKYRSLIDGPFDIIYWDKCGITEDCGAENYYRHVGIVPTTASKKQKILKYFGFYKYVNKILKQNDYKKLIIFPTQVSWLILGKLKGKYRKKYLLDIRDYAGENKPFIRRLTAKAVRNAKLCSVTSDAYKTFLPDGIDYLVSHNVQEIDKGLVELYRNRQKKNVLAGDRIVLSFIGTVRFIDNLKELIKRFSGDNRFLLRFIGRGSDELKSFVSENGYGNVELVGQFERSELAKFYFDTDIAINLYGNANPYLDYALSNKLYSAAIMGMPILVSPKTYMAEVSEKYGFGFASDVFDEKCADKVFAYYDGLDLENLHKGCDAFMDEVKKDEKKFAYALTEFLKY
ncbi:MAG: hypothetical protein IKX77_03565 [Clostridia bacterium]|nr:hypothetical protein [Clostridia bacterium]MBR4979608.1 hypothetical protein [Clostridia bacterium]